MSEPPRRPLPRRARREDLAERRRQQVAKGTAESEPGIVRKFRQQFASYVSVNGSLLLLNIVTGLDSPWFLFPAIGWGIGIASQYGKLWSEGYSWRDVINRPPAKDAIEAPTAQGKRKKLPMPDPSTGDFGKFTAQLRQAQNDQRAIQQMVGKLPDSEKKLLPEILPTVESLVKRALELGHTLNQMEGEVDDQGVARLDKRIEELETEGTLDRERQRRLDLLQRQKKTLADLVERRNQVDAQFESCILAIQNMRFDLLRLRSAGVSEVLDDLTLITQQAKALSVDVNAAIDAAGEIREALGKGTPT